METIIDRLNSACVRLGLGVGEAHAKGVRGRDDLLVIDMAYGYHVCTQSPDLAQIWEGIPADTSHRRLVDTLCRTLDPFLAPAHVRERVRWTGTGGQGPHFYGYR